MPTIQALIDNGLVTHNDEGARECGLLAMYDPAPGIVMTYEGHPIVQIDQYNDGCVEIVTASGRDGLEDHLIESILSPNLDVEVYRRIEV